MGCALSHGKGCPSMSVGFRNVLLAAAGCAVGIVGFIPLQASAASARRSGERPSLARGMLAVMLSFAVLSLGAIASWIFARDGIVPVLAGMLVGFFAMWGRLAHLAMGRRL